MYRKLYRKMATPIHGLPAASWVDAIMGGCLDNLPSPSLSVVRIFLSSTFTDMTVERNYLMTEIYPNLKRVCRENYGVEFQVVDMRWGVRNAASDDHSGSELCFRELRMCQKLSLGPTFVTFLGDRYGSCPLPSSLPAAHMEVILRHLHDAVPACSPEDLQLLDDWYVRDENATPCSYILQPVSTMARRAAADKPALMPGEQEAAGWAVWAASEARLGALLQGAVSACLGAGTLPQACADYFTSVTEKEIAQGVLQDLNPNDHCLCFIRKMKSLNPNHNKAWRFIDMNSDGAVDQDVQTRMKKLRQDIRNKLNKENVYEFETTWSENEGINQDDHAEYLKSFGSTFANEVFRLIDKTYVAQKAFSDDRVYQEVLEHSHQAANKTESFEGREEILVTIKNYVTSGATKPLVIHGNSGCGKTSVVAKATKEMSHWKYHGITIFRFLGTTPDSSNIHGLLTSLCKQICRACNLDSKMQAIPANYDDLKYFFLDLLDAIPAHTHLVLLLDSLDQLSMADDAHSLGWLPSSLAPNVKLVVSTLPQKHQILERLRRREQDGTQYVEVNELGPDKSKCIIDTWMRQKSRTITKEQKTLVDGIISKPVLPIMIKLIFDEIVSWHSYDVKKEGDIEETVSKCIDVVFQRLEDKHGDKLVQHAFMYLTLSKNGLTETEMEDLLSLDDIVLSDVFQFHVPSVRRLPSILWARIRSDVSEYMVDREADGSRVMSWYHRQFVDTARLRYARHWTYSELTTQEVPQTSTIRENDSEGKSVTSIKDSHLVIIQMFEYFSGKWHNKKKSFVYTPKQVTKLKLKSAQAQAYRHVSSQPNTFSNKHTCVDFSAIRINRRKISELPYCMQGLIRYGLSNMEFDDVMPYVAFYLHDLLLNVEFLSSVFASGVWKDVTDGMGVIGKNASALEAPYHEKYLNQKYFHSKSTVHHQINVFRECIMLSYTALYENPYMLPASLSGRLHHIKGQMDVVDRILESADTIGPRINALVSPHFQLEAPGGEISYIIHNHVRPINDVVWNFFSRDGEPTLNAISVSDKMVVINFDIGEVTLVSKPRQLPEGDCFKTLALNVTQREVFAPNDDSVWAALEHNPVLYKLSAVTGNVLQMVDLQHHGATAGFQVGQMFVKKHADMNIVFISSVFSPQVFYMKESQNNLQVYLIEGNDYPIIAIEVISCIGWDSSLALTIFRKNNTLEIYGYKETMSLELVYKIEMESYGVPLMASIQDEFALIAYDSGVVVLQNIPILMEQSLSHLLAPSASKFLHGSGGEYCDLIQLSGLVAKVSTTNAQDAFRRLMFFLTQSEAEYADEDDDEDEDEDESGDDTGSDISGDFNEWVQKNTVPCDELPLKAMSETEKRILASQIAVFNKGLDEGFVLPDRVWKTLGAHIAVGNDLKKIELFFNSQRGMVSICEKNRLTIMKSLTPGNTTTMQLSKCFQVDHGYDGVVISKLAKYAFAHRQGTIDVLRYEASKAKYIPFSTIEGHSSQVTVIQAWKSDAFFVSGSHDGLLKFWNVEKKSETVAFDRSPNVITSMQTWHASDNTQLAFTSSHQARSIDIWDLLSGKMVQSVCHPEKEDTLFVIWETSPVARCLVALDERGSVWCWTSAYQSGSEDMTVFQTKGRPANCHHVVSGPLQEKDVLLMTHRGEKSSDVIIVTAAGEVALVECGLKLSVSSFKIKATDRLTHAAFMSASTLLLKTEGGECIEYSLESGQTLLQTKALHVIQHSNNVSTISSDGSKLSLFDIKSNKDTTVVLNDVLNDTSSRFVVSRDGGTVVTWKDTTITAYTGNTAPKEHTTTATVEHLAVAPSGEYIAFVHTKKDLKLVRVRDMRWIAWYTTTSPVCSLQLSASGWFVCLATLDRRLFMLLITDIENEEHNKRIPLLRKNNSTSCMVKN